jgi:3-oxoadipate enol-lactonase
MTYTELNGVGLRYELTGQGERTIVLVHEMGGTMESWDEVAPRLAATRRVLRYDTRGAGMSTKVRGRLTIDTMADDILGLLDVTGIKGKVALAGIAVGGAIALHFAARHPDRVSAVVVGSPATSIEKDRQSAVLARVAETETAGMAFAVEGAMQNGYPEELRGNRDRYETYRARWLGNDPASYATIYRMLAATDLSHELKHFSCPALVIGGELDRSRPAAVSEAIAKTIPGARYKLLRTGHYMAAITPELIADTIAEFLKSVGA